MKRINSQTLLNDFPEPNLEPPAEEEDCIRCEICGSGYEISNYRGWDLCPDCAYDMYYDDIYKGG